MEYFMDEMEDWELLELFSSLQYSDRNGWEQARNIMWVIAQTNSKKQLELQDIMKFSWEDNTKSHDIEMTNNDISKLKSMAERYMKNIQNNNNGSTT